MELPDNKRLHLNESKNNKIRLITYQSKEVLNQLKNNNTYYADYNKIGYGEYKLQYKKLAEYCGFSECPIFCAPEGDEGSIDYSGDVKSNGVRLELSVPSNECYFMDYYAWGGDYLYYSSGQEYDDYYNWGEDKALDNIDKYIKIYRSEQEALNDGADTVQVVINRIEPEWVVNLKEELIIKESLKKATPYMLRNDGELFECQLLHPYIKVQFEHDTDQAINYLINSDNYSYSVQWFYDHTNSDLLKEEIRSLVKSLSEIDKLGKLKDKIEFDYSEANYSTNPEDIRPLFEEINDATNQEFCRVRTSSIKYGGYSGDIYFRISSVGFNWFNIIWELVARNKNFIESITICKDTQTFGGRINWYKINGIDIHMIPTEDFLTLKGNPVIEDLEFKSELNNYSYTELCKGNNLLEVYNNLHPRYVVMNYKILKESYINNLNNYSLLEEGKEDYYGQYTFNGYAYYDKQYTKVIDEFHLDTLANSVGEAKRNFIKQIHDKTGYYTYIKEEDINLFSVNPKEIVDKENDIEEELIPWKELGGRNKFISLPKKEKDRVVRNYLNRDKVKYNYNNKDGLEIQDK